MSVTSSSALDRVLKAGFGIFHLRTDLREEDGLVLTLDIGVNRHFQVILPEFLKADQCSSAKARGVKGKFHSTLPVDFFAVKVVCRDRFSVDLKRFPGFFVMSVRLPGTPRLFSALHTQRVYDRYLVIGFLPCGSRFLYPVQWWQSPPCHWSAFPGRW